MAWTKGQSGNPAGKTNDKWFADALRRLVSVEDPATKRRRLFRTVEKLLECAENGESWAIQQVADRLDGKPAQESTVNVNNVSADQMNDNELAGTIAELRAEIAAVGPVRGNGKAPVDPSQLN
jgi:hypothetical protein